MRNPAESLRQISADGLLRKLRTIEAPGMRIAREGRELWNFASNDYLGLAGHPAVAEALIEGVQQFGAGATASRLVSGSHSPHLQLEEDIAAAKHAEAALAFSSGFAAAMGAIPAIVGKGDTIVLDKLCHASLVDAARLSGATIRVFPHNRVEKLRQLLESIRKKDAASHILVVTESVFSMDGDLCPLAEILDLTEQFDADLFLDEAHAVGVLGETGMGLADDAAFRKRVAFQMGTLSKSVGLSGGYIAASREWIDLFINRARSFIYSTAPPPTIAHAARRSLEIIRSSEGDTLRSALRFNISLLDPQQTTPIVPVICGSNASAIDASGRMEDNGFLIPAIRWPTVPRGSARLRASLSAAHPADVVRELRTRLDEMFYKTQSP
ncbi:8-amino-7-oxononanoate synthase [Luteolibacter pohnpeiensis]|uniref:8-amino-7-oxononanoate synthase n=1 Tax=Luteolibacter pohnpeiensis TaxID=454153 RepID=A0A934S4P8_9BACT|nr:8-amino-7-oxononanoate synthase [Luteolibacter pohnpeiensis]MBK1882227.1 8-amino-7-oxononanoate synthase [Luteolibacter pohnpeiensis]